MGPLLCFNLWSVNLERYFIMLYPLEGQLGYFIMFSPGGATRVLYYVFSTEKAPFWPSFKSI